MSRTKIDFKLKVRSQINKYVIANKKSFAHISNLKKDETMIFENLKKAYFELKKTKTDKFKVNFMATLITEIHAVGESANREPTNEDSVAILNDIKSDITEELERAKKRGAHKDVEELSRQLEILEEVKTDVFDKE